VGHVASVEHEPIILHILALTECRALSGVRGRTPGQEVRGAFSPEAEISLAVGCLQCFNAVGWVARRASGL